MLRFGQSGGLGRLCLLVLGGAVAAKLRLALSPRAVELSVLSGEAIDASPRMVEVGAIVSCVLGELSARLAPDSSPEGPPCCP